MLQGRGSRAGERVLVLSTHLEPLNARVRTISAQQVLAEATRLRLEHDCHEAFLLGDFNCDCEEDAHDINMDLLLCEETKTQRLNGLNLWASKSIIKSSLVQEH